MPNCFSSLCYATGREERRKEDRKEQTLGGGGGGGIVSGRSHRSYKMESESLQPFDVPCQPEGGRNPLKIKCIARPVHVSITFFEPPPLLSPPLSKPHPQTRGPSTPRDTHTLGARSPRRMPTPRQPIALNGTRGVVVESCFLNSTQ